MSWFKVILPWLESLIDLEVLNYYYKLKLFMLKGVGVDKEELTTNRIMVGRSIAWELENGSSNFGHP